MTGDLPDWYPLANATDEQIDRWLAADQLPYAEMRDALPWLDEQTGFDAWIKGLRSARAWVGGAEMIATAFPGIALIPLPPRHQAEHAHR